MRTQNSEVGSSENRARMRLLLGQWATAISYCERLQHDLRRINRLCMDLDDPAKAQVITGMPTSSTPGDPTARAAMRAMEMRAAYEQEADVIQQVIAETLRLKRAIDEQVRMLTADERQVIELRYCRGYTCAYIGTKMHYHERQVKRIEFAAVEKMSRNVLLNMI